MQDDFAPSSSPWADPLVRHLALVLAAKLVGLMLIWWLFFRAPEPGVAAGFDVHRHIAGPSAGATHSQ